MGLTFPKEITMVRTKEEDLCPPPPHLCPHYPAHPYRCPPLYPLPLPTTTFLRIKFLSGAFLSLLSMVAYMPFLPTLPNNPFHSILGQQTFLLSLETHSFLTLNYVCRNEAFLSRLQCYNSFRYFPAGAYLSSFPT